MVHGKRITIGKVRELLEKKAYGELDALYRAVLNKQFAKEGVSGAIHRAFDDFNGLQESNEVIKLWIDSAPDSPFALAARGIDFGYAAAEGRVGDVARKTSDAQLERMGLLATMSIDLLEQGYPAFARTWFARAWLLRKRGKPGAYEAHEKYISLADPKDQNEAAPLAQAKRINAAMKRNNDISVLIK